MLLVVEKNVATPHKRQPPVCQSQPHPLNHGLRAPRSGRYLRGTHTQFANMTCRHEAQRKRPCKPSCCRRRRRRHPRAAQLSAAAVVAMLTFRVSFHPRPMSSSSGVASGVANMRSQDSSRDVPRHDYIGSLHLRRLQLLASTRGIERGRR